MRCKNLTYDKIEITDGFWRQRQELVRSTTVWNVYRRFAETGRFDAFKLNWKEGEPNKPHIYWDSDVAKWIEGVAYMAQKKREPKLEAIVDEVVDDIARGRMADGYFNSYYQQIEPQNRFTVRNNHELYCAGHLLEAAIAYDAATGKGKFLELMKDYVAFIKKVFMDDRTAPYTAPGHEELELALVKLYDYTQDRQYLDLALYFINVRGQIDPPNQGWAQPDARAYEQDHQPVREQEEAIGHAVRAVYLYCAMADLAARIDDPGLTEACDRLFTNISEQKMYITGAIGSAPTYEWAFPKGSSQKAFIHEAFEENYRLTNETSYAETCAALGYALFARRMALLDPENARYADTVERIIYNGFLSGWSLDGKSFFYENAHEIDLGERRLAFEFKRKIHFPITQRVEVFGCSCCPPNVVRFIPSIAEFLYHYDEKRIYVDQYMSSVAHVDEITLTQKTGYPFNGQITLTVSGGTRELAFRIPAWCKQYTLCKNQLPVSTAPQNGYVLVSAEDGDVFTLELTMQVRRIKSNPRVRANRGMTALTYGPFVLCMEGVDNGEELCEVKLVGKEVSIGFDDSLGVPAVFCPAVRENTTELYSDEVTRQSFTAKFIPYFAFANRGETDMRIWVEQE